MRAFGGRALSRTKFANHERYLSRSGRVLISISFDSFTVQWGSVCKKCVFAVLRFKCISRALVAMSYAQRLTFPHACMCHELLSVACVITFARFSRVFALAIARSIVFHVCDFLPFEDEFVV